MRSRIARRARLTAALSICTAALLLAPGAAGAPAPEAAAPRADMPPGEATAESIARELARLTADGRNRVIESEGEISIDAAGELTLYTFTRPGHPAHPSMVRRNVGQRGNGIQVATTGVTAGDRTAFKTWFGGFLREDEALRARLKPK